MRVLIEIDDGETASQSASPMSAASPSQAVDAGPAPVGEGPTPIGQDARPQAAELAEGDVVNAGAAGAEADLPPSGNEPAETEQGIDAGPAPEF